MMQLIDFDSHFAAYLKGWMLAHEAESQDMDRVEAMMPEIYEGFLDTPADWLQGRRPGDYFDQWEDPELLIGWMGDYLRQRVSLPDMLLNRIAALKEAAAPALCRLLDDEGSAEKRMLAVSLLREIGSTLPMQRYIDWQVERSQADELCDNALESLEQMGEAARDSMLEGLEGANLYGKEALLSVLSHYPGDERVLDGLLSLLERLPARRAVLAAYLGRLGDVRALPALEREALKPEAGYLDYIELRSAIEALGGEAPEREFYDDPEYEALFGLKP